MNEAAVIGGSGLVCVPKRKKNRSEREISIREMGISGLIGFDFFDLLQMELCTVLLARRLFSFLYLFYSEKIFIQRNE